jgi:hypothetical protein
MVRFLTLAASGSSRRSKGGFNMTNVEALKNLYVKLGGSAEDVENVSLSSDMIEAIAGLDIGGGSGGLTVKRGKIETEVPAGNKGYISILKSDLPEDFVGGLNVFYVTEFKAEEPTWETKSYVPLWVNSIRNNTETYLVWFYRWGGQFISFEESDLAPAGTKVRVYFEYLAKEE